MGARPPRPIYKLGASHVRVHDPCRIFLNPKKSSGSLGCFSTKASQHNNHGKTKTQYQRRVRRRQYRHTKQESQTNNPSIPKVTHNNPNNRGVLRPSPPRHHSNHLPQRHRRIRRYIPLQRPRIRHPLPGHLTALCTRPEANSESNPRERQHR